MNKSEKKMKKPVQVEVTTYPILLKSSYTGKTPRQVMTNHIRDRNDVITEDDFNNLNISLDITSDTRPELLVIPDDKERSKDEDKDPGVLTPWDLIKE